MISIDDHPPPDPSSSNHQQQIAHDLKINSDEKAPASVSHIDLPNFSADEPNFCMREYVFGSRSKDITCNWPFSCKHLQLCLQHGVKNLLPPFEPLGLRRDSSSVSSRCTVENRSPNEEILSRSHGKKPADDQFVSVASHKVRPNQELALECIDTSPSRSKGDKEHQAHLQEDLTQKKSKKCKLLVKLNSGVEPVEETTQTPNSFVVSETMASKTCPVCKTFSSSSNTTLNAHIDQCLSGESNVRSPSNPRIIARQRIKPRKSRLVDDIYKNAPHCTVEELEIRNGTSWANNSSFPDQELECQGEEDKENEEPEEKEEPRVSAVIPEVNADREGAVYIDTDGTKVRILSMPEVGTSDDREARKLQKGEKGSKITKGKKKSKIHGQKHHQKYLKLSPNSKKFGPVKPHHAALEIDDKQARSGREENGATEERCKKEDRGKKPMKAQDNTKMDELASMRPPWACSKRTGIVKKMNGKDGKLLLRHKATKELVGESEKFSSGFKTPVTGSSSQSMKNIGTSSPYNKQPSTSNRAIELNSGTPVENDAKKRSTPLSKSKGPSKSSDIRSKRSKLSSLKKNPLPVSREVPVPALKSTLKRKFSAFKKSQVSSEENTSEESSMERLNIFKIRKKTQNQRAVSQGKSTALKGSNGDLSARLKTPLCDVESLRNETDSHDEQARGIDLEGSFLGLRNYSSNKFDSQESTGLYQNQTLYNEDGMDDSGKRENYFQEVEPILIPGPPGSFLPSPGGEMVSEEVQGNSSLTTTSINHHRDSMSPVSAITNTGFQNDQPCCCSRKEASFASIDQESAVLSKQQALESKSNKRHNNFNFINYPSSLSPPPPPATLVFPSSTMNGPSDVASPKPVLRLMGKNLTVVKTDEDLPSPQQFKSPPPPPPQLTPMGQQNQNQELFRNNVQNEDYNSLFSLGYHPQHHQNVSESQRFNIHTPYNSRNLAQDKIFPITTSGHMASMDCYGNVTGNHMNHTHNNPIIMDGKKEEDEDQRLNEHMRRNWAYNHNSPNLNPFYSMYQSQTTADPYGNGGGRAGGGGLPVFGNGCFQASSAAREVVNNGNLGNLRSYPSSFS